ncbi:MAG: 2-succinyl-5-enolpyruvyl-6-hydroxy-3-cyclohexene-1-carboxylic-acid synthase [Flavobacteriaceae bacterium]
MKYSNIPSAQSIVFHCQAQGIKDIIISPGSRNAPLTIGFTENPFFRCYSIVDERCAAFFALGISQQSARPAALVCTSGSALLNYYPAIAEAFYSDIPLIVISADRPPYKIDIGDGQTIRQENVFAKHIAYSANLVLDPTAFKSPISSKPSEPQEVQEHNDRELNTAFNKAIVGRGPVHINVPFEEPLYETISSMTVSPNIRKETVSGTSIVEDYTDFLTTWNNSTRKMVLVGTNPPNSIADAFLEVLGTDNSVLVLTETTSNLYHPNFFPSIDSIVAPLEKLEDRDKHFRDLRPQIVLTIGGMIVSKKIKAFLREYSPDHHWHVGPKKAYDTFFCLSQHFKIEANEFFKTFLKGTAKVESNYYDHWNETRKRYRVKRENYLKEIPFSDMFAFSSILRSIPKGYQVQLANSSTVRYAQLFDMDPSLEVFSNRGTSGIDGSTSTAIGASMYCKSPTLLLTGDLSFLYDSNALWNDHIRADFRIIVINNGGGGIFRILPGKEATENFEKFFETVQNIELKKLCSLFDLDYALAQNEKDLSDLLSEFYKKSERPKLLEIRTPRFRNDKILLTYFDFLS